GVCGARLLDELLSDVCEPEVPVARLLPWKVPALIPAIAAMNPAALLSGGVNCFPESGSPPSTVPLMLFNDVAATLYFAASNCITPTASCLRDSVMLCWVSASSTPTDSLATSLTLSPTLSQKPGSSGMSALAWSIDDDN